MCAHGIFRLGNGHRSLGTGAAGGTVLKIVNPLKRWRRVLWIAGLGGLGILPVAGAQEPFAECEARFAKAPSDRDSAVCFREVVERDSNLREEAIRRLERLLVDYPEEPWVPYDLAGLEWYSGGNRASDLYAESARRFAARRDLEGEFGAREARVTFLSKEGRLREAQEEVNRLVPLAEQAEGVEGVVRVRLQKADLLIRRGRLEEAAELLERDRQLVEAEATSLDAHLRGKWLHKMALVTFGLGKPEDARKLLRRALEVVPEEDPAFRADVWYQLANIDLSSRFLTPEIRQRGEEALEEARILAAKGGNRQTEVNALWWLGKLAPGEEGIRHLRRCAEVAPTWATSALCLSALASKRVQDAPEEARDLIDQALSAASETEERQSEIYVRREKMRVDWVILPRAEAIQEARETLDLIEEILVQPTEDMEARAEIRATWFDLGYWLVGKILESRETREGLETAFEVLEVIRARTLRESLSAADVGAEISRDPVRLEQIESALAEDEALVVFQVGLWDNVAREFEGGAWALAVTRDGTRVYPLRESQAIEEDVHRLSGLDDLEQAGSTTLVRLHRQLLEALLEDLPTGIHRLTLVADGALHALPFAALRANETVGSSLAARFELSQVPSATFWHGWRSGREVRPPAQPALVLADPDLGDLPEERPETSVERGIELGRLPYARREGRAVIRRLGGRLVMDEEASEHALKTEPSLAGYGVLHLAVHAVADTEHPERSTVYLAPGDGEDGRLTPAEIVGLDLQDRLVVLAGCETATGELLRGEGALSLARYFFQAGARTVVASLKKLPDETAADLFDGFYRHLAEGLSVAEALSLAQRAQLQAGGPTRVWAGVQVYGDGDLVPFPGGLPEPTGFGVWQIAIALGLVVVLAGSILVIRRRSVTAPSP